MKLDNLSSSFKKILIIEFLKFTKANGSKIIDIYNISSSIRRSFIINIDNNLRRYRRFIRASISISFK